jgi:hypothetical protein
LSNLPPTIDLSCLRSALQRYHNPAAASEY